ncbi:MAG: hypothetical protein JO057_25665 [Chloroflexi bacterium]|nr:hypothetical protein [Chloroflexota bacterium]
MRSFFGFLLMLLVPLALAWVPVPGLGAAIGGLLGGYVVGRPGRAFILALLPVLIVDVAALVVTTGLGLPIIGAVVAGAAFIFFLVHSLALLAGAILGGFFGQSRRAALPVAGSQAELYTGTSYR